MTNSIRLDRLGIRHACSVPGTESDWEGARLCVPDVWSIACLFEPVPYVCVCVCVGVLVAVHV